MAGGACAHSSACVIDFYPMGKGNIQDAAGETGMTIWDLLRIDLNGDIHGKECDGEFLSRRSRRFLINVRVRTTHRDMLPLFHRCELLEDSINRRTVRCISSDVLPRNLSLFVDDEHGRT